MSKLRTATVYVVRVVSPTVDPEDIAEQMTAALVSALPDTWEMMRPSIDVRTVNLVFRSFEGGTSIDISSGPYEGVTVSSTTTEHTDGDPAGSTGVAALKAHVQAPRSISGDELQGFRDAVRAAFSAVGIGGFRTSVVRGTQNIPGDFGVPPTPPLPGAQTNLLLVAGVAAAGAVFLSVVGARRNREQEEGGEEVAGLDAGRCPVGWRSVQHDPMTGERLRRMHCWNPRTNELKRLADSL